MTHGPSVRLQFMIWQSIYYLFHCLFVKSRTSLKQDIECVLLISCMTAQTSKFSVFFGIILSAFKRSMFPVSLPFLNSSEIGFIYSLARVTCETSQVLLAGGQLVFLGNLPFSPHLTIDSAQNE